MRLRLLLGVVLLLLLVAAAIGALAGRRVVLVAKGAVPVDSYPAPRRVDGKSPATKLQTGQQVSVLSCDDLKAYPAIHVRLPDGSEGYVIEGAYELILAPVWSRSTDSPVSFSCL